MFVHALNVMGHTAELKYTGKGKMIERIVEIAHAVKGQ
jgi:hypothetical protein